MITRSALIRAAIILGCCIGFLILNQSIRSPPQYMRNLKYTEPIQENEFESNYSTSMVTIKDIITQQKLMFDYKFAEFPFPKAKTLNNYQLATNGQPVRSIIITTWRSGSTFLGDVLNALPGNFYHYEPLLNFGIVRIRGPPLARTALTNIKKLLDCDYGEMESYLRYGKSHLNLFTHNHRLWNMCHTYPQYCWNSSFLTEYCKLFPFQSMKIVRLNLKLGRKLLLDKMLGVKVLLLVRDPRGTLQSRKHRDWCPGIDDCDNPQLLCKDLLSDYKEAAELQKLFPERFRAIRYEDLSLDPYTNVKSIFSFFGLHFHPDVVEFLNTHTKRNVGGVSSTFRDSKSAPFHWKLDLDFSEVEEIQHTCSEAMRLWGYVKAVNETHQKEFDPLSNYVIE